MGLFNRDYDRQYGDRGYARGGSGRDYDREMGNRGDGGWDRMKRNTREFFGMENRYDRGYRYDRDLNSTYSGRSNAGTRNRYRGGRGGYDQSYEANDADRYDDQYKSRDQTDRGDPFGDRASRTPIRVVDEPRGRSGWFGGSDYDRGYRYDRGMRGEHGSDYRSVNPMGYDPYESGRAARHGYDAGYGNRGYDRNWF